MTAKSTVAYGAFWVCLGLMIGLFWPTAASAASLSGQADGVQQQAEGADLFPILPAAANAAAPNCRYGVSASRNDFVETLKVGAILSFGPNAPYTLPSGVEHIGMIRLKQDKAGSKYLPSYTASPALNDSARGLGGYLRTNPGGTWVVGNEVDRIYWQDDMQPQMYAEAYHDIYHFIKERDPSAQVAVSGLVQVTPGRIQYLDLVYDAYLDKYGEAMPADVWTFHAYVFAEKRPNGQPVFAAIAVGTDPALALIASDGDVNQCQRDDVVCVAEHDDLELFTRQITAMRTWMKEHGYQNRPLVLTEYSQLFAYEVRTDGSCQVQDEFGQCFAPPRVVEFMDETVTQLEQAIDPELGYPLDGGRMVQQWYWFSLDDFGGVNGMDLNPSVLVKRDLSGLTPMGEHYRDLIATQPTNFNLVIDQVGNQIGYTASATETATVSLTVTIRNNGNTAVPSAFRVRFYRDAGLTQEIGNVRVDAGLGGCTVGVVEAAVDWPGLTQSARPYWVKIDAENSVPETNETDNTGRGLVLVNPHLGWLPLISQR